MKNKNLYYGLIGAVMTGAFIMKIAHIQHADSILTLTLVVGVSLQSWYIFKLVKTLNQPSISNNLYNRASSFFIIVAVALKMAHAPYADILLILAFLTSLIMNNRHIKKISEQKTSST